MESHDIDHDRLQQYFDGELPADEATKLQQEIADNPRAQQELSRLTKLQNVLRQASSTWEADLDSNEMFASLEKSIEMDAQRKRFRVLQGGAEPAKRRRTWALGLAAAASIAFAVFAWPEEAPLSPNTQARGSEVLRVDFGDNTGTVFEIEGNSGQPIAVVWISDEEVVF